MWEKNIKYPLKSYKKRTFATLFCLFAVAISLGVYFQSLKPARAEGEGARVITVFDDGKRQSFKTDAKTVADALKEQQITVGKHDSVEPSLDDTLTGADYNVNIYRAEPVTVKDGSSVIRILTSAKTNRKIATEAGIKLRDEDIVKPEISSSILETGDASYLKVQRAKHIVVELFGKHEDFYTQAKTFGDFLKEKNITLGKDDVSSRNLNEEIKDNDNLSLWRDGVQTVTENEPVDFPVEKIQDGEKPIGFSQVKEAGEKGEKAVVYEISMKNGKEVSRKKISETETKKPKKQVMIVGAKQVASSMPGGSHTDWMAAAGISPSDYGYVNFIINRESTWRTTARNGQYAGLGQTNVNTLARACPGWQSDPVCQLRFFTGYATSRYGSWAGAHSAWKAKGWW